MSIRTKYGILVIVINTDVPRRLYTTQTKSIAKQLAIRGIPYSQIRKQLNIPKSTLSTWFGKTIKKPMSRKALLKHLASIRPLASASITKKYLLWRTEEDEIVGKTIQKEIQGFPFNSIIVYKSLLAMLYWAEGEKHEKAVGLKFVNTDPKLSLLYITLLRSCYLLDEKKISIGLHIHYYHSIKRVRAFWSRLLHVPDKQFNKIFIKKRSAHKRFRRNFAGICFIYYGSSRIRKELMALAHTLQKEICRKPMRS